jgi:hypothetical protein
MVHREPGCILRGIEAFKIERTKVLEYRLAGLKTVSNATVSQELYVLPHMLNVAIGQNIAATNPARGGSGVKVFEEQGRERRLEMNQVQALLAAIQVRAVKRVEVVDVRGLEPLTSSLRTRRSPN